MILKVKRVQKYVETLDMLKIKNSMPASNGVLTPMQVQQRLSNGQREAQAQEQQPRHYYSNGQRSRTTVQDQQEARHSFGHSPRHHQPQQQQKQPQPSRHSTSGAVVITTNWETFDSAPAASVPASSTSASDSVNNKPVQPKFTWDLL